MPGAKVLFCLVFERELLSVPATRQVLGDTLRGIGVNEDSVADILLAVTEACTNAVLHAGQSAPAYSVAATVGGGACRVEVADAGQGFHLPGGRPPVPPDVRLSGSDGRNRHSTGPADADRHLPEGRPPVPFAESGRGFAIMRACMDAVTLRTAPGQGTRVVLDKRIHWEASLARIA